MDEIESWPSNQLVRDKGSPRYIPVTKFHYERMIKLRWVRNRLPNRMEQTIERGKYRVTNLEVVEAALGDAQRPPHQRNVGMR
jgi:hypothetical protein